jgi:hypothetical protein
MNSGTGLTKQQKRELELLANVKDEEIDLSEMPEITDFSGFERGPFSEILQRRREHMRGLKSTSPNPAPAKAKRIA